MIEREDGKVFPASFCAEDVRNALLMACMSNGLILKNQTAVTGILPDEKSNGYTVHCEDASYQTSKIIIATGGCSYPGTGSDGSFFSVLNDMGFTVIPQKPALTPIYVEDYPYKDLAGISFRDVIVSIEADCKVAATRGDVLFTHHCFSGPAVLDLSEYAKKGYIIRLNYFPQKSAAILLEELSTYIQGNSRSFVSVLYSCLNVDSSAVSTVFPKRFLESICRRCEVDPKEKASHIAVKQCRSIAQILTDDHYRVSRLGDIRLAMATAGGVALEEVDTKTLEAKKHPGLYFAGEVLDVAGKTGGYNLQFAFSSGHLAALEFEKSLIR